MGAQNYLEQLEKKYPGYLKSIVSKEMIFPIVLRGGKEKPTNTVALSEGIAYFISNEKSGDKKGWTITWKNIKFITRNQNWPSQILIESEEDLLHLLKKEKEVKLFKQILQQILEWNPSIQDWLVANCIKILALEQSWKGICDVVDYFLQNDVSNYYLRSLPVPVHTKFIEDHKDPILPILKHFFRVISLN